MEKCLGINMIVEVENVIVIMMMTKILITMMD